MAKINTAQGLRRKAAKFHRLADLALADRRVWDATQHRTRARTLEARADRAELAEAARFDAESDLAAGFRDEDLPAYATARPQGWLA